MKETQARMKLKVRHKDGSPHGGELGIYVGSGDGEIDGAIRGSVKWDLFEMQGDLVCSANLTGTITAPDNGELEFSALGFFARQQGGELWRLRSGIRFKGGEGSLSRFSDLTGIVTGDFDMSSHLHDYRIEIAPAV